MVSRDEGLGSSFDRVAHAVGELYEDRNDEIENALITVYELPEGARSVSVGLDRVSMPMIERRTLPRDRLLLLAAIAQALLTLLGAPGEACGLDRLMKTNTRKTRTMSLLNRKSSRCHVVTGAHLA